MIEERPCDARGGLETRTVHGEIWDDFPHRTLFRSLENRFLRLAIAINVNHTLTYKVIVSAPEMQTPRSITLPPLQSQSSTRHRR